MASGNGPHADLLEAEGSAECDLMWWGDALEKADRIIDAARKAIDGGDMGAVVDMNHGLDMRRVAMREGAEATVRVVQAKEATRAYRSSMGWADRKAHPGNRPAT